MRDAQIFLTPALNWFVVAAAALVVAVAVALSYRRLRRVLPPGLAGGFAALKIFLVIALVFCLAGPVVSMERRLKGKGVVAVLLDTSASMAVKDSLGGRSRILAALDLLGDGGELLDSLAADYSVSLYRFDEALERLEPAAVKDLPGDLKPETAVYGALSALAGQGESEALAAVVLISDGRETASSGSAASARELGVPVYTVGVGSDYTLTGTPNLAILSVKSPAAAYLNNSFSLDVSVGAFNLPEGAKFGKLTLSLGGKTIAQRDFRLPESGTVGRVALEVTPDVVGFLEYTLELTPLADEEITADNVRKVYVDVREPRLRVLYVEGLLRPEYGFVRRVLSSDPDVKVTSLVRTRKDSFLLQGESPKADLSRGLPDTPEGFDEFDVIILGDVSAAAFREYQIKYLREWVEKGGGLMMLGGHDSFSAGGWRNTPLGQVLPVKMSDSDPQIDAPLLLSVTASGRNHPVFKGIEEFDSAAMRKGKGALSGCTGTSGARSGAQVLAVGRDPKGKTWIVCAAQKFSKGRALAFTADTTGKSHRELVGFGIPSPWPKFWGQAVRWLAGFDEMRKKKDVYLSLSTESRFVEPGKAVELSTAVKGNVKNLAGRPSVSVSVVTPAGETVRLQHSLDGKTLTGSASFTPRSVGLYTFKGRLEDASGKLLDESEYTVLAGQPWLENANLALDEPALKELARSTGGKYYTLASAARLPDDIASSTTKGVERVTLSLWNNPYVFLLLLLLLSAEWYVRRRNQLL